MAKQTIGEFLATQRKAKGFTQQYVADLLGVSNKTLSAWETNKAYPDILVLPALAELYGVTADEILNGERRVKEQTAEENFSEKSREKLYKSKLARNSAKNVILICVGILAAVMVLIGWCLFLILGGYAILMAIAGILTTIFVLLLVIAFSRTLISGNTDFGEEVTLSEKQFIFSVNVQTVRTIINMGYVWLCCGIIALIVWLVYVAMEIIAAVSIVFYCIIPLAGAVIVLIAAYCGFRVIKNYGNEEQKAAVKYNAKLAALCSVSVIPLIVCVVLVIIDSVITLFGNEVIFVYLFLTAFAFIAVGITIYACKHKKLKIK